MRIHRGLDQAIVEFNEEQKIIIRQIAKALSERGYPVDQVTEVRLGNSRNIFEFVISPMVILEGTEISPYESVEFNWDKKSSEEGYTLHLSYLPDSYPQLEKNQDDIIEKINQSFLDTNLEIINFFPRLKKGLKEISRTHDIQIFKSIENKVTSYKIILSKRSDLFSLYTPPSKEMKHESTRTYTFKTTDGDWNLDLVDSFMPGFFPSPAAVPKVPTQE